MNVLGKVCALLTVGIATTGIAPQAKAELRNPYVVETNIPQYFGDSGVVDGHQGLENYSSSYVNGYLHIYFTTTHDICCYAGYPPTLLVTTKDPRLGYVANDVQHQGTLSPNVNFFDPPNAPTDWYSVDIQFSNTGYSGVVRTRGGSVLRENATAIAGMNSATWIALYNNYPVSGCGTGSADCVYSMAFAPMPLQGTNTIQTWTQKFPSTSPPARYNHAMAFDSVRGQVVLFGGTDETQFSSGKFGDTWVWDGTNWTQKFPSTSPPARENHAMAFDPVRGVVVLFGGVGTSGSRMNDTWVWDGLTWTQQFPVTSPPALTQHAMAYDVMGQVVLFGGSFSNQTWVWNGTTWAQKASPLNLAARAGAMLAYPGKNPDAVLFGGTGAPSGGVNPFFSDTWIWSGMVWSQPLPLPSTAPPGRAFGAMAGSGGEVVLFGGYFMTFVPTISVHTLGDTWVWDGSNWNQQSPTNSPSARTAHAMAYDVARAQFVIFGGTGPGGRLADTWVWDSGSTGLTGTLSVTTNLPAAAFTISGPTNYSGSGTSFTQTNAPAGSYTITYGAVSCYTTPPSETKTLTAGGVLAFSGGTYQGRAMITVSVAPVGATSATFSINPPVSGMPSNGPYPRTQSNVLPQSYTVTFNPVGGFATPAPQTVAPSQSCALAFTGTYAPAQSTSTATLSVTFKVTGGGAGGGFAVYKSGSATPVATGTSTSPTVQVPAPAAYTVKYDSLPGYYAPLQQTVTLNPGDSLPLIALYRRLILFSFTGWNIAPNPSNCFPNPLFNPFYTVGSGIRYQIQHSPDNGMIDLLYKIQQQTTGLATGADMAAFTFYSTDAAGSTACSPATDTNHVEARNWFNSQSVAPDDMLAVVGHSYGGNRARLFVDQLKNSGFIADLLVTVDPVDWDFCTFELGFDGALNLTNLCDQSASVYLHSAKSALSFHQVQGVAQMFPLPILKGYTLYPATVILKQDYHADLWGFPGIAEDGSVQSSIIDSLTKLVNTPPTAPVVVSVVPGTPVRVNGSISVPIKLLVAGKETAFAATITVGTLNGVAASGTPVQIGDIPAGTSSGVTNLVFPGSAAAAGATVQLTVTGRYSYYSQQQFSSTLRIKVP